LLPQSQQQYANAQLVAMTTFIFEDFVFTWRSTDDLTLQDIGRTWHVLVTLGMVGFLSVFGIYSSGEADKRAQHSANAKMIATEYAADAAATGRGGRTSDPKEILLLIDSLFPAICQQESLSSIFLKEVKQSHRWFSLWFHYTPDFPRSLRTLALVCAVVRTMFFNALALL
jgi:hypothetical protein